MGSRGIDFLLWAVGAWGVGALPVWVGGGGRGVGVGGGSSAYTQVTAAFENSFGRLGQNVASGCGGGGGGGGASSRRGMLAAFLEYQSTFDGHDAQRYFAAHPLQPTIVVVLYLLMVKYGQRHMESRPPFRLRTLSRVWNLAIALFSLFGAAVCVPHLAGVLRDHGFWYSVCADVYDLAGYGAPALWAALFTWSKLLELIDTALLILKKRPVITLHWFHHASVIGFAWSAWVYETPAALWYGAMNYSVHAVMYTYFALMGTQLRTAVAPAAPFITSMQISQFGFGTVVNVFAAVSWARPSVGCAIHPHILLLAAALYVVYGALFVRLFVARYLMPRRKEATAEDGERLLGAEKAV